MIRPLQAARLTGATWIGQARRDPLYRASLVLLINTGALALGAGAYWTIGARLYPPSDIGNLSAALAAAALLTTLVTFGLPSLLLQHVARTAEARQLVLGAIVTIAALGSVVALVIVLAAGPLLPARLHLAAAGAQVPLIVVLVVFSSVGTATDAGLIALRGASAVLVTNIAGSVLKVALLWPLQFLGYHGLMVAYVAGTALQAVLTLIVLLRRVGPAGPERRRIRAVLREHLHFSSWTYGGTVFGILPSTIVPIFAVAYLGARSAAWLAAAFLFAGTVSYIPANAAQALFAELRMGQESPRRLVARALRGTYTLVGPYVLFLVAAAPLLLQILGSRYSLHATTATRLLALAGLFTGATYIVDIVFIALGHIRSYLLINAVNAVLVVGGVVIGAAAGVDRAALGWTIGQGASLLIGVALIAAVIPRSSWDAPTDATRPLPVQ